MHHLASIAAGKSFFPDIIRKILLPTKCATYLMRKKNERAQDAKVESLGSRTCRTPASQYHNRDPSYRTDAKMFYPTPSHCSTPATSLMSCYLLYPFPPQASYLDGSTPEKPLQISEEHSSSGIAPSRARSPPMPASQRAHKRSRKSFSAIASACDGAVIQMLATVIHITSS